MLNPLSEERPKITVDFTVTVTPRTTLRQLQTFIRNYSFPTVPRGQLSAAEEFFDEFSLVPEDYSKEDTFLIHVHCYAFLNHWMEIIPQLRRVDCFVVPETSERAKHIHCDTFDYMTCRMANVVRVHGAQLIAYKGLYMEPEVRPKDSPPPSPGLSDHEDDYYTIPDLEQDPPIQSPFVDMC